MLDIKKVIDIINKLGYKTTSFDTSIYSNYIETCAEWYRGDVPSFHTVKQYNGSKDITIKKAKLHMAKRISEDIASLVCNENMIINVDSDEERMFLLGNDEMTGILGQNDFWATMSKSVELMAALGTVGLEVVVENLTDTGNGLIANDKSKIKITRYNAMSILPLSYDNTGKITEVAFLDEYKERDESFVNIRIHTLNELGNYVIVNKKCKVSKYGTGTSGLNIIGCDNDIVNEFDTGSDIPWFTVLKTPQINSYAIDGPFGSSCYADAVDELKAVDDAFNTLCGEFRYSSKKIFYNRKLLQRDSKGNVIIPDDDENNRQVYYTGDEFSNSDVNELIHEYNPNIRTQALTDGIELVLDILSFKAGLGKGFYKFSGGSVQRTATEVLSTNSDLFRNVCKMQLGIEKGIYELVKALLYVSNYFFDTSYNLDCKMSVAFDASLIEDRSSEKTFDLELVKNKLMTVNEFRAKWMPELGDILVESSPQTLNSIE